MAAKSPKDPADYPVEPNQCHDKAAPTYEDKSMTLKDIAHHLLTLGYVPLLEHVQQAIRPNLPLWLGPVLQPWMVSQKLVEPPNGRWLRGEEN
jgi:hypothetical protein